MKLWVLSDWHLNRHRGAFAPARPVFDVLVVAGDVTDTVKGAVEAVAALAGGAPAVLVPGPLEFFMPGPSPPKSRAHANTPIISASPSWSGLQPI